MDQNAWSILGRMILVALNTNLVWTKKHITLFDNEVSVDESIVDFWVYSMLAF